MESQQQQHTVQPGDVGTSFSRTCFNGVNVMSGVGILSIPYAISQGGWLSLLLLFLIAVICCYTGVLLQRCMDAHPQAKSYPDVGELAFGSIGRNLVSLLIYIEVYLVAVDFLILEGDSLDKLFPNKVLKLGDLNIHGKHLFVILTAAAILPTTWLRNLGLLAYISVGGVLASLVLLGSVFWAAAFDGVGFQAKGKLVNWGGMPTTLSLFTFCYCGHAVFPTLCNSMRNRSQFSKVLLVCFVLSTISYGTMAVLGYLMYGEHLMSQITLNLPTSNISTKVAVYTTSVVPLTKFALMITPVAKAVEDRIPVKKVYISILVRTLLVISTAVVAVTIPFFGYVMSFIGAFLGVAASMLLPCLCYLKLNRNSRSFGLELFFILGIMVFGSFIGVIGTYTSVRQIVKHL